jgi:predicted NBD/HSP70 family sugar kinase
VAEPALLRAINMQAVLRTIRERGPISRADVARVTSLSRVTVSATVRILLQQGYVRELPPVLTTAGKRAVPLEAARDLKYAIAAVADGEELWVGCLNLMGEPVRVLNRPRVRDGQELERLLPDLVREAGSAVEGTTIMGLGLALTGIVDASKGTVLYSRHLGYDHDALACRLSERLGGMRVTLENDVNAMLLGEHIHHLRSENRTTIMLRLGQGVGGAIMIHGRLHHGHAHMAGEVSDLLTLGPRGGTLTMEDALGDATLLRRLRDADPSVQSLSDVVSEWGRNEAIRAIVEDAQARLHNAVLTICLLVAPDTVVLAGPGWAQDLFYEPLKAVLAKRLPVPLTVRFVADPVRAALWGAAAVVLSAHPLTNPVPSVWAT